MKEEVRIRKQNKLTAHFFHYASSFEAHPLIIKAPIVVGWSRIGDDTHSGSMAVLISNGDNGYTWMYTGKPSTKYRDLLEHRAEIVETNEHGYGRFCCRGGSVSVWVEG
jgi:hypothetical protein